MKKILLLSLFFLNIYNQTIAEDLSTINQISEGKENAKIIPSLLKSAVL